jgi:L-rhamnose isomerase/sugar isomerase
MQLEKYKIEEHNHKLIADHTRKFEFVAQGIPNAGAIIDKLVKFQIAIPSWALGTGGTRFGRFPGGGEPRSLEEKIEDIGLLHALNQSSGAISLHIPWDIPKDAKGIKALAAQLGIRFDAMNSNTFQDQKDQKLSYKFGSLQHVDKAVRDQAIDHNLEVIEYGKALGSDSITVWLSDGSCFPGQLNFRKAFENTLDGLQKIYKGLPDDWKMFVEYKAFEPNFYSMTVGDWGQSLL